MLTNEKNSDEPVFKYCMNGQKETPKTNNS